jgi:tRNA A-37 threonylcarbamoyl transferase component Bud32
MDKGQTIKGDNTTLVSRLTFNGKDVVVKRYNHKGIIHSLRHTIKKSRARQGWLHAHRLRMLQIDTPKPLAFIEKRRGLLLWQSYLVTEYTRGQKLYDFFNDTSISQEERLTVTQHIMDLFERLGQYRISHGDLKHTNILIADSRPILTDLDAMHFHKLNWFYQFRRLKDWERFIRETNIYPLLGNSLPTSISGKMNRYRSISGNFDKVQIRDWIIHIRKDFPKCNIVSLVLANISSANGQPQLTTVPSSDYTRVFKCNVSFNGVTHALYLKQYLYRSVWDFTKHLFRPSPAKRAFEAGLMLEKNGFDTPTAIGLFERRPLLFCTNNMLLTREVDNATPMPALFKDICGSCDKKALVYKRTLIKAFAKTIGQMHAKGIFHGDLRLGNVLVVREQEKWRFYFIDNERTKKFYRLPNRLRLKNLVQVNMFTHGISNTDRLRFFRAYLSENPCIESNYKRWARKITANTNVRLQRCDWFEN